MLYRIVIGLYGLINIAGGVIGFVIGNSTMSLVVGGLAGLFLLYLAWAAETKPAFAFRTAAIVTFILLGFWVYRFESLRQAGDKTMMAMMNLALALVVLAILVVGHMAKTRKSSA